MSGIELKHQRRGKLARAKLINDIVTALKPLQNIEVQYLDADEISRVIYSDNNVVIQLPRDRQGSDPSGGGGGGGGDGFDLVTFDVVKDNNTPGQYRWRADEVT